MVWQCTPQRALVPFAERAGGSTAAGVATAANPAAAVVVGTFLHGSRLLVIPSAPLFGHPAGVLLLYLSS